MKNSKTKLNDIFSYLDEISEDKKEIKKLEPHAHLYQDNRGNILFYIRHKNTNE